MRILRYFGVTFIINLAIAVFKSFCHMAMYLCFVVLIAQLCLVDGVSLFLVDES